MSRLVSNVVKEYPDMIRIYIYTSPFAVPEKGVTHSKKIKRSSPDAMSIHRSLRRTKSMISDLVLCNDFELFCTFTFDRRKVDRYNVSACKSTMSLWLHRQRLHSPDLKYLVIPEFHKDGALHFHALVSNYSGRLKYSGKMQNGRKVYNISSYRSGFTTAVKIDENKEAVSSYIKKYITKDMPLLTGKKRYWVSNNLQRPKKHLNALNKFQIPPLFRKPVYNTEFYSVFEAPKIQQQT